MSRGRRRALIALVLAQALLPLGLIAWNETALATGDEVTLRTAPVDPLDPFRGRYVALRYELSGTPAPYPQGTEVWVPLRRDGEVWSAAGDAIPVRPDALAIRGRVAGNGIRFGIEQYFVDEDEAPRLERGGPLLVDVVLDGDGRARIAGVRPIR